LLSEAEPVVSTLCPFVRGRARRRYPDCDGGNVTLIGVELSTLNGEAILPPCSSNVYQLLAEQLPNPNMFDVVGDAAVKCVL
jgi:hypothetical protein